MRTKQFMKRIGGICVVAAVLLLGFMYACGKKVPGGSGAFVERISPLNEALLPFLDSYTSGVIVDGEPVVVRFNNPATMKVKFGETLPAKAFEFTPER